MASIPANLQPFVAEYLSCLFLEEHRVIILTRYAQYVSELLLRNCSLIYLSIIKIIKNFGRWHLCYQDILLPVRDVTSV